MQLKPEKKVAAALATATCALLGQAAPAAAAEQGQWEFDSAILFYSEVDRVTAIEPVVSARRGLADDAYLDLKLVLDALTGASANGAMPSSQPQTFTRPSGNGAYTVAPGETPLDDTFHDTRGAFSVNWNTALNPDWKMTLGGNVSKEFDFQSVGANILFARDFNKRNTTLSFGASVEADQISPVGGLPTPLARMVIMPADDIEDEPENEYEDDDDIDVRGDTENKTVTDFLLGVTQVLSRNAILQVNYNYSSSSGYMTDPYKLVSVLDTTDGPNLGEPLYHVYENRPDSRSKHALYAGTKWAVNKEDILNVSYRYMTDDWGIDSHTVDLRYRFGMGGDQYIEPHLRYYTQTAADFYRRGLRNDEVLPQYVSADYRLGNLDGVTAGMQYGRRVGQHGEFRIRAEYYQQSGSVDETVNFGVQRQYDLFPTVDAYIVQLSYKFDF